MNRPALLVLCLLLPLPALAGQTLTVQPVAAADEKAVFATVESVRTVPARVRTGGTIVGLPVREGDPVDKGQVVAVIADQKLDLQVAALEAQIAALRAQLTKAEGDLARSEPLFKSGDVAKARLDELRAAQSVAANTLKARMSERSVLDQQLTEGKVLAPTAGRILKVPVTAGSVVMAGEPVAIIASREVMVRLSIPERHARQLKAGDPVRLDGEDMADGSPASGRISLIYPQIENGRVSADAKVDGVAGYFVGQRVRAWISGGARKTFVIPESFVTVRFGLDYVTLQQDGSAMTEVPVQRGRRLDAGVEILSGLRAGDVLVSP